MKSIFFSIVLCIATTSIHAQTKDECKSKALKIAKAIDAVYAKPVKNTMISITKTGTTANSFQWLVNFYIPNAGGQTAYVIEMQKESCEIMNLSMFSE